MQTHKEPYKWMHILNFSSTNAGTHTHMSVHSTAATFISTHWVQYIHMPLIMTILPSPLCYYMKLYNHFTYNQLTLLIIMISLLSWQRIASLHYHGYWYTTVDCCGLWLAHSTDKASCVSVMFYLNLILHDSDLNLWLTIYNIMCIMPKF